MRLTKKMQLYIDEVKVKFERHALSVTIFVVILLCSIIAVPSLIVLILAKVSEQPPTMFHTTVEEGKVTQLDFSTENCPKISFFYSNPAEQDLYLQIIPDTLSKSGISLSFFSSQTSNDSNIYFNRFALCYALPGDSCTIAIPKNVFFYAVIEGDSNYDDIVDTMIFRWECLYTTNVPLITSTLLFTLSMTTIITTLVCIYTKQSIIVNVTKWIGRLHGVLTDIQVTERPSQEINLEEILTATTEHRFMSV